MLLGIRRPLISHDVIVNLIANTTKTTGLRIHAAFDIKAYSTGLKVSEQKMKELQLRLKSSLSLLNFRFG